MKEESWGGGEKEEEEEEEALCCWVCVWVFCLNFRGRGELREEEEDG